MKKALLLCLLLPALAFGASSDSLYWTNAAADNDMNNPANYTEGDAGGAAAEIAATDTLFFSSGSAAATASGNIAVAKVKTTAGYSGAWSISGKTLTVDDAYFDATGTLNLGNAVTVNGASGTFHVGSSSGTVTATSYVLTMNGTTAMVLDDDKGITANSLTLGANAVVTNSGSATTTTFTNSGTCLTFTNGGALTANQNMKFYCTGTAAIFSITGSPTFNGTGQIAIRASENQTVTLPAITYTGSGLWLFEEAGTITFQTSTYSLGGAFNIGTATFVLRNALGGNHIIFNTNNYPMTTGSFRVGAQTLTSITFNAGASIFNVTDFSGSNYAGLSTIFNMGTSQWTCTGNWTFGSNYTVTGSPIVTLNGSGAQTVTSNGKSFYDLTINNSGSNIATPVSFADSATLTGDLNLTDGPFLANGIGIEAVDYTYNTADSVRAGRLWLSGNYTRAAGASKCDTSGQQINFLAGVFYTMAAANKTYAEVTANGPLTIDGGATITLLSYGVDGIPVSIASGTTLTAGSIAGIGGTPGSPDTLQGVGGAATLDLAGNQTVTWQYTAIGNIALAAGDTIIVSDGTSINLGGNTGAIIWPHVSGSRKSKLMYKIYYK
jgi:hypothetical protein